ncbi:MAG: hypothetical protein EB084_24785 [Proteobacteria bacterium]|nr:hypothetical protein [Pseudomonadota bacterium]
MGGAFECSRIQKVMDPRPGPKSLMPPTSQPQMRSPRTQSRILIDTCHSEKGLYEATDKPSITDIHQGNEGDCYFLSSLGAKVMNDPTSVQKMIATNKDGSYMVSFANRSIKAPPLSDADIGRGSSSGGNGRRVTVMERAYALYTNKKQTVHDADTDESIIVASGCAYS